MIRPAVEQDAANGRVRELDTAVVGFGPAGIAFACAVADSRETCRPSPAGAMACFESSASTAWHGDFLLRDTDINHHVFRDLVTPRNPRSRFSFAMYLKDCDRLHKFGLLGRPPSRIEWSSYVRWVAAQLSDYVSYSEPVSALTPIVDGEKIVRVKVITAKRAYVVKTVILSLGSCPNPPELFVPHLGPSVFHTSRYLSNIKQFGGSLPQRWLVVGSGQSAGEAVADLLARGPRITVDSVHRSSGFNVGQLGQFPNVAFLPEHVDYFHGLPAEGRKRLFRAVRATNYAGIDVDQSRALYSQMYEEAIEGKERLRMFPFSEIHEISRRGSVYRLTLRDVFSGEDRVREVDAIVLGTGFEQPKIPPLLAEFLPWLPLAEDGSILIERDYRIALNNADVAIYANGLSERTHGIGDAQSFSLVALRSECILNSLTARARSKVALELV